MKKTIKIDITGQELEEFISQKGSIDLKSFYITSIKQVNFIQTGIGIEVTFTGSEERDSFNPSQKAFLESAVKDNDITVRLMNCLKESDIKKMGEVLNYSLKNLFTTRLFKMSKKAQNELIDLFNSQGLKLND